MDYVVYIVTYRYKRKVASVDFYDLDSAYNFFYTSGFHCYSIYFKDSYGKIEKLL